MSFRHIPLALVLLTLLVFVSSERAFASGGGCYTSYSGACLAGFTDQGSLGTWGYCQSAGMYAVATMPRLPGAACSGPVFPGSSYYWGNGANQGTAILCCKN